MAGAAPGPNFNTRFDPQTGVAVELAPGVVRLTAPNAGPFTFTGTNSYLLGRERVAIVDPGPNDSRHLSALREAIAGRAVDAILLTHTHRDHCALAHRLAGETGAPLWFAGAGNGRPVGAVERLLRRGESSRAMSPDRILADGDRLELGGLRIAVVATPGHAANHLCFGIEGTDDLLSGDHVMGWSSSMIAAPDGSMADYLAALRKVAALPYRRYLPGHGGEIADGPGFAMALHRHRELRNAQIRRAVDSGASSTGALLQAVYPGLALPLIPAARMTLRAHLDYLTAEGEITMRRGLFGPVLSPAP